ncbi:MAG: exodeoxyribonuclease VII large subunit [Dysgonamonadaceae bacterium]|jgi:exodeoxyribonuclease VII large subunit|nr:exodeoxyribonuclease VII large subunit [Dysgonamonadaceae bacterium]
MTENCLSLSELNAQVRNAVRDYLPDTYWVRAETVDVRRNQNGNCYLEFVEKDPVTQNIVAKARGIIWGNTFRALAPYFESETGQVFASGLNVLVRVTVDFHEVYGYSLTVGDIDPSFTVGEIARNRRLVLKKLEEEGVLTLNKELEMPELANRIAVISSPTAAGYEDFCHQLERNPAKFVFYTKLFPAVMQGDRSEASIVAALERIYEYRSLFDAVAIIRGGGATSELSCFDSYPLATNCAQFPLPIVSGIGHERDVSVLDVVAHTRAKTPTAVAEFFIEHIHKTANHLLELQERLVDEAGSRLQVEKLSLAMLAKDTIYHSEKQSRNGLSQMEQMQKRLSHALTMRLEKERSFIRERESSVRLISPENILKRGYSLTLKNGKVVKSACELTQGDEIETWLSEGKISSEVRSMDKESPVF